jgi:hypothetical protein
MRFTSHFAGGFGSAQGSGQPIDVIATALIRVTERRVSHNWQIEDNLSLLQQMGLIPQL